MEIQHIRINDAFCFLLIIKSYRSCYNFSSQEQPELEPILNPQRTTTHDMPPEWLTVEQARDQERHRIAREIHDDLGGNLIGIKMALAQLMRHLPCDNRTLVTQLDYVSTLVERSIEATQRIALNQRSDIVDLGLVAALIEHSKQFEKQFGIPCQISTDIPDNLLNPEQDIALFRIFQEALTNIAKHANASLVMVRLTHSKRAISLTISDNGCGITVVARDKPESLGLKHMQERSKALGGTLTISAANTGGSVLTIKLPLS